MRTAPHRGTLALCSLGALITSPTLFAQQAGDRPPEPSFPVEATVLVDGAFERCEGIAFNGEGKLFVAGNQAVWQVSRDGGVTKVTDVYSNLGLAPIGERDLLMADFGPTSRFTQGPNADGIVWHITPGGHKTRIVNGGIGDPNFVLVQPDRSILVSDDATDEIFRVDGTGSVRLFTDAVGHPNGMVLSPDGSTLYVAQIFTSLRPYVIDDRLWAIPLEEGRPAGEPEVIARLGERAGNDGLAMDELGRIYVAANVSGQIWRVDPTTREKVLIAENLPGVASLAFGQGEFDRHAIYATSTRTGRVWEVQVGVAGAPLQR